jgi:uncharacterized protein (TIGR03435 family)
VERPVSSGARCFGQGHVQAVHCLLGTLLLSTSVVLATRQSTQELKFEVASVRPAAPVSAVERMARNFSRRGLTISGRRVSIVDMNLTELVIRAFGIEHFQLSGPAWLSLRRFDIQALLPHEDSRRQVPQMLQTLLRERFALMTHTEFRPIPVYTLGVRKEGVAMVEVGPPTDRVEPLPHEIVEGSGEDEVRVVASLSGYRRVTPRTAWETRPVRRGITELRATRMTMRELTDVLRVFAGRPVLDETGLIGLYQFTIRLPTGAGEQLLRGGITTTRDGQRLDDPSGISLFQSIEKLGLSLVARNSPMPVIVIDQILHVPTDN